MAAQTSSLLLSCCFPPYISFSFNFCLSGWVFLSSCASQSLAVPISLSGCQGFCSSFSPSLSGFFIVPFPRHTELAAVTASQDLILTLLPLPCFILSPLLILGSSHFLAYLLLSHLSLLLFKGTHPGFGNPALHTTSRCGFFLMNLENPRRNMNTNAPHTHVHLYVQYVCTRWCKTRNFTK